MHNVFTLFKYLSFDSEFLVGNPWKKKKFCVVWDQFHWILTNIKVWNFMNNHSALQSCKGRRADVNRRAALSAYAWAASGCFHLPPISPFLAPFPPNHPILSPLYPTSTGLPLFFILLLQLSQIIISFSRFALQEILSSHFAYYFIQIRVANPSRIVSNLKN